MNIIKPILRSVLILFLVLVAVSFIDIFIAAWYGRGYSTAVFVVLFGVGGVFGTVFSYMSAIESVRENRNRVKWWVIGFLIFSGLLIFFLIAKLEGGEYEGPFKAFGLMTALTTLLFFNDKGLIKP